MAFQYTRGSLPLLLCLWLSCLVTRADQTKPDKQDYSKEGAVIERSLTRMVFQSDGTYAREQQTRVKVVSDSGVQQYGILVFPYQDAAESVVIKEVKVTKHDGSVVVTPQESIQDMNSEVSRQAPFYSDLREKHVAVRGLEAGDTLEYSALWNLNKPLAPGQFWFSYRFLHQGVILDEELELSVPRAREVKVKSATVMPTKREERDRVTYVWNTSHVSESDQEKEIKKSDHYNRARGSFPAPDVLLSSFRSWEEVGRWYESLQREQVEPTAEVKAKAAELTKGLIDDKAKINALYKFVSLHYRYIGIAFGIGRYQPHSAADILANQYGDCKDKHTLLASLLRAVGIHAYPALINSQTNVDVDIPSPGQFDHVITAVANGDEMSWMDSTAEVAPLGYLISPLRDKPALVISAEKVSFQDTPSTSAPRTADEFTMSGKLSADGVLESHADSKFRGDSEVIMRAAFRRLPESQWQEFVQSLSYVSGFAGTVDNIHITAPEATEEPFALSYQYHRKDFADWANHRIMAALPPFGLPSVNDEDLNAKAAFWLGGPGEWSYESRIELPKGFSAELPPALNLKEHFGEVQTSSTVQDGVLITKRHLVLKARDIAPEHLDRYKAFQKAIVDDEGTYIPLKAATDMAVRPRTSSIGEVMLKAVTELPASEISGAQQAEDDARNAMQQMDRSSAIAALKIAVSLDPKFARAWIELGSLYAGTPDKHMAMEAFRKATEAAPKAAIPWKILAFAYAVDGRRQDAISTWEKLRSFAPDDQDITPNLAVLYMEEKRDRDAATLYESFTQTNPDNAYGFLNLGRARVRAGDTASGLASFDHARKLDSGAEILNDVAYEMSEVGVDLSNALSYSQTSIQEIEAESKTIDLDDVKDDQKSLSDRIAAYWDTLGWIYYKMGDYVLAESYLSSSWELSQIGLVGDHLGQLYEKQGKPAAALRMYNLALEVDPKLADTPQRMAKLAHTALPPHRISAGQELSQMRTIQLPRIIAETVSAEFYVLLSPGKVEDAAFLSGSERLRDAEDKLKQMTIKQKFPRGSEAHLLKRGILSCGAYAGCSFVFLPRSVTPFGN